MSRVLFVFKSIYGVEYLEQQLNVRFKKQVFLRKVSTPILGNNMECFIKHDKAIAMAIAYKKAVVQFLKNRKLGVFIYVEKRSKK